MLPWLIPRSYGLEFPALLWTLGGFVIWRWPRGCLEMPTDQLDRVPSRLCSCSDLVAGRSGSWPRSSHVLSHSGTGVAARRRRRQGRVAELGGARRVPRLRRGMKVHAEEREMLRTRDLIRLGELDPVRVFGCVACSSFRGRAITRGRAAGIAVSDRGRPVDRCIREPHASAARSTVTARPGGPSRGSTEPKTPHTASVYGTEISAVRSSWARYILGGLYAVAGVIWPPPTWVRRSEARERFLRRRRTCGAYVCETSTAR